jgi:4,5-DOPA dioxygenase extradiol
VGPVSQEDSTEKQQMPVLFIGHGSPMNGIENNEFSRGWQTIARSLPTPKAILCISAHWETDGTFVTAMDHPRTIHDFSDFPPELYTEQYPAPGSAWLAHETRNVITTTKVRPDSRWGLDHGCWIVLKRMFPDADIPVVQLSLDRTQEARYHYNLAMELLPLRKSGILIIGSGNLVHNLMMVTLKDADFNTPFGFDWAIEANALLKQLIIENRFEELADYRNFGNAVRRAVPTPEHYLPMLYPLALREKNEPLTFFNDKAVAGSITMTSFKIG